MNNNKHSTSQLKAYLILCFLFAFSALDAAITYTVGSYVGTGSSLTISSLAFQPDVVIIKGDNSGNCFVKTSTMSSTESKQWTSSTGSVTNAITGLTSNGFTIGTNSNVNTSSNTYYFYAFQAGTSLKVGTYTGNGSASRNITIGASSDFCLILSTTSGYGSAAIFEDASFGGGYAYDARASGSSVNTGYSDPASPSTGATTIWTRAGSAPYTNQNSKAYHYIAFVDNSGECTVGAFTGNGSSQTISSMGFKPQFVMALTTWTGGEIAFKGGNVSGTYSQYLNNVANATNLITGFTTASSGGFSVGSNADVNSNTAKVHYVAFGGAAGGVLPIELLHFDAQRIEDRKSQINWSTASEENNDYFSIERSIDGVDFETIGKVQGAENSITRINYQFIDENTPTDRTVYYRLRQTDKDGVSRTFTIDAVPCLGVSKELELAIAQNPILNDELVYDMNLPADATINVQIIDNLGNIATNQNFYYSRGSNRYALDASSLKTGVYILNVNDLTSNSKKSIRFVVNK